MGYQVLVVLLALTVCPFLLKHLISIAFSRCWSDIERPDTDDRLTVVAAQVSDSSSSSLGSPRNSSSSLEKQDESYVVRSMYNRLFSIRTRLLFYLSQPNAYRNELVHVLQFILFLA